MEEKVRRSKDFIEKMANDIESKKQQNESQSNQQNLIEQLKHLSSSELEEVREVIFGASETSSSKTEEQSETNRDIPDLTTTVEEGE